MERLINFTVTFLIEKIGNNILYDKNTLIIILFLIPAIILFIIKFIQLINNLIVKFFIIVATSTSPIRYIIAIPIVIAPYVLFFILRFYSD